MRGLLGTVTFVMVMALAFWAYRENYQTQAALRELSAIRSEIAERRSAVAMLEAEWAYLNRPDRLRDLAEINFDRLGLVPMEARNIETVEGIPFPPPPAAEPAAVPLVEQVVSTRGRLEQEP